MIRTELVEKGTQPRLWYRVGQEFRDLVKGGRGHIGSGGREGTYRVVRRAMIQIEILVKIGPQQVGQVLVHTHAATSPIRYAVGKDVKILALPSSPATCFGFSPQVGPGAAGATV